jgi:integrating conjugative element protein (TIGR03761 family)
MTSTKTPSRPGRRRAADPAADAAPVAGPAGAPTGAQAIPAPLSFGQAEPAFETEPNSPWPDGYSIQRERAALADLLATDNPNESDPRYSRLVLLDEREREYRQMQAAWKNREGADAVVTVQEAMSMQKLGSLVDDEPDTMTLHTKEAYRLFMGRARDPGGAYQPIVGGKRIAAALKSLWMLTGLDNPYADWALVRHEHNLALMRQRLADETKSAQADLNAMKRQGLSYALLVSQEPKGLTLGFKSPYGYAIAELVVTYDYYIRAMKTLGRKNLRSDDQVRQSIREVTRMIRRHWNETARFERWLLRAELQQLGRADYLAGASAEALKRVEAATSIFGPVPPDIFVGRVQPRNSRRRMQLSAQERKLLQDVGAALAQAEAQPEARPDRADVAQQADAEAHLV